MTFAECIPLLLQGEKVRRQTWKPWKIRYVRLYTESEWEDSQDLIDNAMFPFRLNRLHLEASDWEAVE